MSYVRVGGVSEGSTPCNSWWLVYYVGLVVVVVMVGGDQCARSRALCWFRSFFVGGGFFVRSLYDEYRLHVCVLSLSMFYGTFHAACTECSCPLKFLRSFWEILLFFFPASRFVRRRLSFFCVNFLAPFDECRSSAHEVIVYGVGVSSPLIIFFEKGRP